MPVLSGGRNHADPRITLFSTATRGQKTVRNRMLQKPNADDLLVLLTVARLGKFQAAASALGVTHTTVSRRIAELDRALNGRTLVRSTTGWDLTPLGTKALQAAQQIEVAMSALASHTSGPFDLTGTVRVSSPEAFSKHFVTPASVAVQREHPRLNVEIISATRRAQQHRSGVDVEIVIGNPEVRNSLYVPLTDYSLRLYATEQYLTANGTPRSLEDLRLHRLISYAEGELQVIGLGRLGTGLPSPRSSFQSNGIFSQHMAARRHGGIALLPSFMVEQHHGLVPVLQDHFEKQRRFGAIIRTESIHAKHTQAVLNKLALEIEDRKHEFS